MESNYLVRDIQHPSGEKSPTLFVRTNGLPDRLANDWKLERRSVTHSHQTLRQELLAVAFFYDLSVVRSWDLVRLFGSGTGLTSEMLATLLEDCGLWRADARSSNGPPRLVTPNVRSFRVGTIRKFCVWLLEGAYQRISGSSRLAESLRGKVIYNIQRHERNLKASRSAGRRRSGLTQSQISVLQSLVDPTSPSNPFQVRFRLRNFLVVQLLLDYGLRRGELLGLTISDVDYRSRKPKISIYRRPDAKVERRTDVAVKTRERSIAMNKGLASLVRTYDKGDRKILPRCTRTPYLFLGSNGEPLGTDGFQYIFKVLRGCAPELAGISGHILRHTWADAIQGRVSERVKAGQITANLAALTFNFLGGWTQQSTQSAQYSQGFIESTANELYLEMSAQSEPHLRRMSEQLQQGEKNDSSFVESSL